MRTIAICILAYVATGGFYLWLFSMTDGTAREVVTGMGIFSLLIITGYIVSIITETAIEDAEF